MEIDLEGFTRHSRLVLLGEAVWGSCVLAFAEIAEAELRKRIYGYDNAARHS